MKLEGLAFLTLGMVVALSACAVGPPVAEPERSQSVSAVAKQLKALDPRDRVQAVRALCTMRDSDAAARLLVATFGDDETYVEGEGFNGHAAYASPGSSASLCVNQFGGRAVRPLIRALQDRRESVRSSAVSALGYIEALGNIDDPRIVASLIEVMLKDPAASVRYEAAKELPRDNPRVVSAFVAALMDPATGEEAANALGAMQDPFTIDPLIDALAHSQDWPTRSSAARALGAFGGERAVEPLIAAMDDAEDFVRMSATAALANIKDPRVFESLVARLRSDDAAMQIYAAGALGDFGDKRAVEPLISALTTYDDLSDREIVRKRAATSLGQLKDFRATPALVSVLRDPEVNLRGIAALALGALGDPSAVEPLIAALPGTGDLGQSRMADALGDLGDVRAVVPLIGLLEASDYGLRRSAVVALGKLKDRRAIEPLTPLLISPLAIEAARALETITGDGYMHRAKQTR